MKQSRLESLIEASVNTMVGLVVTSVSLPFINYLCQIDMTVSQMGASTLLFTVISVVRSYVIRRFFNNMSALKLSLNNFFKRFSNDHN